VADVVGVLDGLVACVLEAYPYVFTVATTPEERATAYKIRVGAVVSQGWAPAGAFPEGLEHDAYDDAAVHVVGWDGDDPISTGRLVIPPVSLPTEGVCGLVIEPHGRVVDVGRMSVVPTYQTHPHAAFVALLCRLYLEMRSRGYEVACGMISPRVRNLLHQLGLELEVLGPDRVYWGEPRAPVRFALTVNARSLGERWPRTQTLSRMTEGGGSGR
jgi:hypothetical protein